MTQAPSIGRIVHYRLSADVVRPAIIVDVDADAQDVASLQVFVAETDGPLLSANENNAKTVFRSSTRFGDDVGTCFWPVVKK